MREKGPQVSVIILNYNGGAYVVRCLGSILKNSYRNFEVIFVDNDSSDGSVQLASRLFNSNPHIASGTVFPLSITNSIYLTIP
jgi:hypothetical protein